MQQSQSVEYFKNLLKDLEMIPDKTRIEILNKKVPVIMGRVSDEVLELLKPLSCSIILPFLIASLRIIVAAFESVDPSATELANEISDGIKVDTSIVTVAQDREGV